MTFRSRPLLDLAQQLPCTLRFDGCMGRSCVPAHSNWQSEGKGKSEKASDWAWCAACPHCHHILDAGKTMTRSQKREAWIKGFLMTVQLLWERALIVVSGKPAREPLPARMQQRQKYSESTATPGKCVPRPIR